MLVKILWYLVVLCLGWACYIGGKIFIKAVRGKKLELSLRKIKPSDTFIAWDKDIDIFAIFKNRKNNDEDESQLS